MRIANLFGAGDIKPGEVESILNDGLEDDYGWNDEWLSVIIDNLVEKELKALVSTGGLSIDFAYGEIRLKIHRD